MGSKNAPEPAPKSTSATPAWELVIKFVNDNYEDDDGTEVRDLLKDMRERDATGRAKYGVPLQAGNGRNALVDAAQELLDHVVYLRTWLDERGIDPDGVQQGALKRDLSKLEIFVVGQFIDSIEALVDFYQVLDDKE